MANIFLMIYHVFDPNDYHECTWTRGTIDISVLSKQTINALNYILNIRTWDVTETLRTNAADFIIIYRKRDKLNYILGKYIQQAVFKLIKLQQP